MTWQDAFQKENELVLTTSSLNGEPHAIIVICKGLLDNKILINVCQMQTSLKNLQENPKASLVSIYNGEYYRINGKINLYSEGKYFDLSVERNAPGTPEPNYALTIDIEEVFDVDKMEKLI